MNMLVALPSARPGGLEAYLEPHFGHCDLYTLVEIENGEVKNVDVIPNIPHEQGGCMAPVMLLKEKGVNLLIAGGMGMRPLMGFNQVGIEVFFGGNSKTVGTAVDSLIAGKLIRFGQEHTCGGGGDHHPGAHQAGGCQR
jgi:predicted Fe-Mo cluster-binding NifX family protein